MSRFQNLVARLRAFIPWSLPLKLVLSAVLGVLGGAGLLGYLSEYATYNYAIYYGIRPPLEGIPYLRPAVAFGSLFLLSSGALVFFGITMALRSIAWYFDVLPKLSALPLRFLGRDAKRSELHIGRWLTQLRSRPLWQLVAASLTFATLGVMALLALDHYRGTPKSNAELPKAIVFVLVYLFAVGMAVLRPSSAWWTAILVTVAYFATCVYLLFSPQKYSDFLRILGYGGGLTVRIEVANSHTDSAIERSPQQLMLRTNEAFILYDRKTSTFSEIPKEEVRRIVHDPGGMGNLPFALPEKVNRWAGG